MSSSGDPIGAADRFGSEYFQTVYRNYERQNPTYKRQFYRDFIARHAGTRTGGILDVGCAFGGFLSSLPREWQRFGIDISPFAIQEGRRLHPDLRLEAATLDTNPFSGPFDVVTSFDVIEHIQDLENVAQALDKLLKPGGLLVFVVPAYDGPLGPIVHLLDRDPTHVHKTSRRFWTRWASSHFEILEWMGMYRILLPPGVYIHWPTKALRCCSPAIIVAARKRARP